MDRRTILKPEALDPKRLPLGAVEGFVLSQVDGQLTLEEIAQITNVDLAEAIRIANLLVNLGAASPVGDRDRSPRPRLVDARVDARAEPARSGRPDARGSARPRRVDPRAEPSSVRPDGRVEPTPSVRPARASADSAPAECATLVRPTRSAPAERAASSRPARSPSAPVERAASSRPARSPSAPVERAASSPARASSAKTAARAERRRSRRSLAMQQATAPAAPADETCELDEATVAAICALEAKVPASDLYGLLEVERSADKKQIKRAYFAIAARYHPDRFFKKKLGPMRVVIERVFQRVTEAHDTLTDPARRAAYDATLPPSPSPLPSSSPSAAAPPSPTRKPSRPRLSSKALKASRPSSATKKPSSKLAATKRPSTAKLRRVPTPSSPVPRPVAGPPPPRTTERREQLRNAAMEIKAQARIDLLVAAAEKALREHDPVTAETNYRLALQHREDPFLRDKLEGIEIAARIVRYEKHLGIGKAHEREARWAEAAKSFLRAHDARPQAEAAARAANALRLGGGDLEHAADLAESAVSLEPSSVAHRVILVEIHAAAGDLDDAREELADLVALAPKDERTKACAALLDRVKRRSD